MSSVQDLTKAMDVVERIKRENMQARSLVSRNQQEEELQIKLTKWYSEQGLTVTKEIIAEGVQEYLDSLYALPPQNNTLFRKLAIWHVTGGSLKASKYAALTALALIGVLTVVVGITHHRQECKQEATHYQEGLRKVIGKTNPVDITNPLNSLPDSQDTDQLRSRINTTYNLYLSDIAKSREEVLTALTECDTREEAETVIKPYLKTHTNNLKKVEELRESILTTGKAYTEWLTAYSTAPQINQVTALNTQASQQYLGLRGRDIFNTTRQLRTLISDIGEISTYVTKAEAISSTINHIAKEDKAKGRADILLSSINAAAATSDVVGLKSNYTQLQDLLATLQQSYNIKVVNESGIKSGIGRYPTNNPGSPKRFYLIVRAFDTSGRTLTLPIVNEETNQTTQTTIWGERVPESLYNRVRDEKKSGVIRTSILATKETGRLQPSYILGDKVQTTETETHRITKW